MAAIDQYVEMLEDLEPGEMCRLGVICIERLATQYVAYVFHGDRHVEVPGSRTQFADVCVSRAAQFRLTGAIAR